LDFLEHASALAVTLEVACEAACEEDGLRGLDATMSSGRAVDLQDLEEDVKRITALSGGELKEEVRQVIVELVQLDVVPTAIAQVLKSLCNKAKAAKLAGAF